MKQFMDEDFLLTNETAKHFYHDYAETLPVIDYHCHINPQEIAEDKVFENMTQVWLGADHYKWRLMRAFGIPEQLITGDAPAQDKFRAWARTLSYAIGNPLYHWSHLELKRYFGYDGCLNEDTADDVWELCNRKLKDSPMSARNLIRQSHVKLICTTDDPVDTLEWHRMIRADKSFDTQVLPAWRPDRAMNLEKPDYLTYLKELEQASGISIHTFENLMEALEIRLDYFEREGCSVSDHGPDRVFFRPADQDTVEAVFQKRLNGELPDETGMEQFKTAFLIRMGRSYHRRNWVMQLHFNCIRNSNDRMFRSVGPDTGFDAISDASRVTSLAGFLNALDSTNELPKTIVYSLNPTDNAAIGSVIGSFQGDGIMCKVQHGSAWWFNDHLPGMAAQMTSLASVGLLAGFVGMLTDSRSFLSYTRHEYFRRLLCDLLAGFVERGEYPEDEVRLKEIIRGISYNNAVRYFRFHLEEL